MALEEEQSSVVQEMRPAIDCLRNCADLAGVDAATLDELAADTEIAAVHMGMLGSGKIVKAVAG